MPIDLGIHDIVNNVVNNITINGINTHLQPNLKHLYSFRASQPTTLPLPCKTPKKKTVAMQLTALVLLVGAVASMPVEDPAPTGTPERFTLTALQPNTPIHEKLVFASDRRLWISPPSDEYDAQCDGPKVDHQPATMFIEKGKMYLYGGEKEIDNTWQFMARLGLQSLYYREKFNSSGTYDPDETDRWSINHNRFLSFRSFPNFMACPRGDGSYYIRPYTVGVERALKCIRCRLESNPQPEPVPCRYT
ncbi:hypothetical protein B0J18DRAFT_163904 [Chaetomium sp. MPI-SDFR-AT-0129]|nr:hypothetical protein B0J18DRAFT_163904 [Chaetomium sp. MPI-SDFR-AT-0129]